MQITLTIWRQKLSEVVSDSVETFSESHSHFTAANRSLPLVAAIERRRYPPGGSLPKAAVLDNHWRRANG